MVLTELEKYIINLRYVISILESDSFSREEIIEELKKDLDHALKIRQSESVKHEGDD